MDVLLSRTSKEGGPAMQATREFDLPMVRGGVPATYRHWLDRAEARALCYPLMLPPQRGQRAIPPEPPFVVMATPQREQMPVTAGTSCEDGSSGGDGDSRPHTRQVADPLGRPGGRSCVAKHWGQVNLAMGRSS